MNDYDFGKYYRRNAKSSPSQKRVSITENKLYRKISAGIVAGLILYFAGFMTGLQFQSKRIVHAPANIELSQNENSTIVSSADLGSEKINNRWSPDSGKQPEISANRLTGESSRVITQTEMANQNLKKSLMDPENEYIILARKYGEDSRDRALYYTGVLNKIAKDYNYEVFPSIRGKNIKLYVGPMKGKKMAEKMLAKVKSIPEFTNSAILYKK